MDLQTGKGGTKDKDLRGWNPNVLDSSSLSSSLSSSSSEAGRGADQGHLG